MQRPLPGEGCIRSLRSTAVHGGTVKDATYLGLVMTSWKDGSAAGRTRPPNGELRRNSNRSEL